MTLITGGAYQGKTDYAAEIRPGASFFDCSDKEPFIDFSADVVNRLHLAILAMARAGEDPLAHLEERLPDMAEKIVICDDISCGVVPIDAAERKWREDTGRCLAMLSKKADGVVRLFCGIATVLK